MYCCAELPTVPVQVCSRVYRTPDDAASYMQKSTVYTVQYSTVASTVQYKL